MPLFVLLIGLFAANASAEEQWFDRHSEGWFWYEHIAEPETEKNEFNDQNERHQPLTTAWIRKNIGQYLDLQFRELRVPKYFMESAKIGDS